MEVMHFKSQKERLDYLKGGYEEILPSEVVIPQTEKVGSVSVTEPSEGTSKKKSRKGKKKDDTVQAE